eukprot:TRINITY_DN5138_c0_g1_i3.p1 TRINITY_DN5138_c0_g1~~TRINITY_DN5138_c0_g1_i3.p1  ORF type:complete len:140 (+),score=31.57 TRINITY_DN5138_c0_g1_i3:825-1244(+)
MFLFVDLLLVSCCLHRTNEESIPTSERWPLIPPSRRQHEYIPLRNVHHQQQPPQPEYVYQQTIDFEEEYQDQPPRPNQQQSRSYKSPPRQQHVVSSKGPVGGSAGLNPFPAYPVGSDRGLDPEVDDLMRRYSGASYGYK